MTGARRGSVDGDTTSESGHGVVSFNNSSTKTSVSPGVGSVPLPRSHGVRGPVVVEIGLVKLPLSKTLTGLEKGQEKERERL